MTERIPFHRPMILPPEEKTIITDKIEDCHITGMLTNGKNVRKLEESIRDYYGVEHAIATSSASQGLLIALQSIIKSNQLDICHIHTQAFAWYSSLYAIETVLSSRWVIFEDIDTDTWTIKQNENEYNLALPVHTFGNTSHINAEHTLYDGAHALGSSISDIGDATVLSLAPTKIITSIEGGIILTDDNQLAEKMKFIRDKISRMSEIHAIFGNAYLSHIEEIMNFKRNAFFHYKHNLDGVFQKTANSSNHNTIGMLTSLKIPDTIETKKYYEPLSKNKDLINTQSIYESIVCLPSYFNCPYKDIAKMINNFNKP